NIDSQIKAYIDNACQTTVSTLIDKVKELINQQAETQKRWNEQLQNTINDRFGKLEQVGLIDSPNSQPIEEEQSNRMTPAIICSTPEMKDDAVQDNRYRTDNFNFQHTAQYKLLRHATHLLQSANETLTSVPPREIPFTTEEIQILLQIDSSKFNVESVIDVKAFRPYRTKQGNPGMINEIRNVQHQTTGYFNRNTPLDQQAANLEPPKHKTYKAIIKRYQILASKHQWKNEDGSVWPISKDSLTKFIKLLSNEVSPPTITSYLSALKFHYTRNSYDWMPVRHDSLIREMLKTIEANHRHKPVRQKMHITRTHLHGIRRNLNLEDTNDLLFWTVALTAFYGIARLGELLPDGKSDGNKVPQLRALKFENTNSATFATIQLARTKNHKSAIRTTPNYAPGNELLFVKPDGAYATKRWFRKKLQSILPNADVSGHSFRAGGTTELVMRGVQPIMIQKIGRWNSDAFYRYIRAHPVMIAQILMKAYNA
ncbi:8896_t:CDS:2, partial [Dentiscutata erythropus]